MLSILSYQQARRMVIEQVRSGKLARPVSNLSVWDALGFVLAQEIKTDREYPPFDRSTRDGYAVSAADAGAGRKQRCEREIKAGDEVTDPLTAGTCAQIMTGAAVPNGADAVVMIEHTRREGEMVFFDRDTHAGQNIVPRGSESPADRVILPAGTRLGYAELALAGQVGCAMLSCVTKPRVAILSTGDEVVSVDSSPGRFQIRNSNGVSLASQVRLAGGEPVMLGNAADRVEDLRGKIERGLTEPVLVLSGGVSMGKYDLVETVLKDLGAEFYFDAVAIRPGKPAVFARCKDALVFGLPGNPVSTMVTFELFVTPALAELCGSTAPELPLLQARLGEPVQVKPGLTHFLPARVTWPDPERGAAPEVKPLRWQGSGDIATMAQANGFLVLPADGEAIAAGEYVSVLLRKDLM
jgi:molybdopterin molybdotransferase